MTPNVCGTRHMLNKIERLSDNKKFGTAHPAEGLKF